MVSQQLLIVAALLAIATVALVDAAGLRTTPRNRNGRRVLSTSEAVDHVCASEKYNLSLQLTKGEPISLFATPKCENNNDQECNKECPALNFQGTDDENDEDNNKKYIQLFDLVETEKTKKNHDLGTYDLATLALAYDEAPEKAAKGFSWHAKYVSGSLINMSLNLGVDPDDDEIYYFVRTAIREMKHGK